MYENSLWTVGLVAGTAAFAGMALAHAALAAVVLATERLRRGR
jgi:hypothetical protein